jgi:hypothetical protein
MFGLVKRLECCQCNQRSIKQGAVELTWLVSAHTQRRSGDDQCCGAFSHAVSRCLRSAHLRDQIAQGTPVNCRCWHLVTYLQASDHSDQRKDLHLTADPRVPVACGLDGKATPRSQPWCMARACRPDSEPRAALRLQSILLLLARSCTVNALITDILLALDTAGNVKGGLYCCQ